MLIVMAEHLQAAEAHLWRPVTERALLTSAQQAGRLPAPMRAVRAARRPIKSLKRRCTVQGSPPPDGVTSTPYSVYSAPPSSLVAALATRACVRM